MAIEKIEYIADRAGVHPATRQESGYKLDIAAYGIKVTLTAELLALLNAGKGEGDLVYRFDVYNAAGDYCRTATDTLDSTPIEYELTKQDCRVSGTVRIIPIVTSVHNDTAIYEKRLGIIVLNVKATPEEDTDYQKDRKSLSSLEVSAREAASAANAAKEICIEAQAATEAARAALEAGAVFIFEGGDAETEIPIHHAIDDVISEFSLNPVTSRAIAAKLLLFEADIRSAINLAVSNAVSAAKAEIISDMTDKYHGIGSFIFSADDEFDPNEAIPGTTWAKIGAGKTLIDAGTLDGMHFVVGESGGEAKVTLTTDEIPAHSHLRADNANLQPVGNPGSSGSVYGFINNAGISTAVTGSAGGGAAHNNIPPFLAVNIWRRVS